MTRLSYALDQHPPMIVIVDGTTDVAIFSAFAESGVLPDYFASNFDSLEACLKDVIDTDETNLILLHLAPLDPEDVRIRIYLDILDALEDHPRLVQIFARHEGTSEASGR